jgi:hypothetical protein
MQIAYKVIYRYEPQFTISLVNRSREHLGNDAWFSVKCMLTMSLIAGRIMAGW